MLKCDNELPHSHAVPAEAEWRQSVERAVRGAGFRLTRPRGVILDHIARLSIPFTAEDIAGELEERQGLSSRATIYRMLDWLCTSGWIVRVQSDQTHNAYTRILPGDHHNLICTRCGGTMVIGGCNIETVLAPVLVGTDFDVHGHVLEVYGHCGRCRTTERRK